MLLEREGELAALHAYVDAASSGLGRLIVIEGRAGIGKTRLVLETRAIADRDGISVLTARGGELEHEFAYGIVRQLFEPVLAAATSDERAELLGGPAALAEPLFATPQPGTLDEDDDSDVSFSMLHGLYWLAANLALRRTVMIVIDDLHWADGPSLRWLIHLQRRLEGLPLLVVAATRPPEQARSEAMLKEIVGDPSVAVVRPGTLGAESVARIAREHFGRDADREFVEGCWLATGGNPLFVWALMDTIRGEGLEPIAANAARIDEIGPEPVTRAVSLRLSRLPSEATVLARAVAVLGDRAELRHAAALAGIDRELAGHAATTLARADLMDFEMPLDLRPPRRARRGVRRHVEPRTDRRTSPCGADPRRRGRRAGADRRAPRAVDTERRPVRRRDAAQGSAAALQRGSSDVAVSALRRALDEPPAPARLGEVLSGLGLAERLLWNDEAIEHLGEAFELIEQPRRRARIAIELGRALMRANRHAEAIEAFRRGREILGSDASDDPDMALSLETELINAAWWEPEHLEIAHRQARAAQRGDACTTASAPISCARPSATGRRGAGPTANARSSLPGKPWRRSVWTRSAPARSISRRTR